ncbi:rhodanese-like domain-containing protein [Halospeciosus flavus]|uniref:Rhodanese-like domain-containing protein n=1 Tax=Halospeciosus flavus TaxID=3032283 RepID=A0ABD5Z6R0_9EURY|nr:rhodanese-like domain-containing protein [Halospeciosus flavus]
MVDEITPEELHDLLESGADVRVVDIRMPRAYERGHIPGSENIPFSRLPNEVERLDGAEHVVTVCPHGKSSIQAAQLVSSYEGIDDDARVESLSGGLDAWEWGLASGSDDGETEAETADEGPQSPF